MLGRSTAIFAHVYDLGSKNKTNPYYFSAHKVEKLNEWKQAPGDADDDGVADLVDLCPATPNGTSVNSYGCSLNLSNCNYNSTTLSINSVPSSPSATQVNTYILTDSIGIIKAFSSTPSFSGLLKNKTYMVVALSYENDGSLAGLTVGQPLSGVNANCKDFSNAVQVKICQNLPPTIQNASFPLAYNAANGTTVGTVVFSDPESLPTTLSITSGNTAGIFAINNLGQITVVNNAAITPGQVYTLVVEITDNLGQKATNIVTITASTNNDLDGDGVPNVLDLCPGTPIGTPVNAYGCPKTLVTCNAQTTSITLTSTPNTPQSGQINSYVLTDSLGIIRFISNTTTFSGLTSNKTYMAVAISYLNDGSLSGLTVGLPLSGVIANCMDKSDAILIKPCPPINLPPFINDATFPLAYNAPNNTVVGTNLIFSDPENLPTTLSIIGGNSLGIFALDNTGKITVANNTNLTANQTYNLLVVVTDNVGQKDTATVIITTGNNDADQDGVIDPNDLCPNTPVGTIVNAYGCPKTLPVCNIPTNSFSLITSANNPQVGQVNSYVLADSIGIIKFISNTPSFTGLTFNKTYMALAISYMNDGSLVGLTVGQPLSGVTATCIDKSDAILVKPCSPMLGQIGDFVWKDINNNGLQDLSEPGVQNVKMILWKGLAGTPTTKVDSVLTDATGAYHFNNLPLGTYIVQLAKSTIPADCRVSLLANVGSNDNIDNDFSSSTGFSSEVALTTINNMVNNIDGALKTKPVPVIADPCTCFKVEYKMDEKKELYEVVEVHSAPNEIWTVVSSNGMLLLDSTVKKPLLNGYVMVEKPNGVYDIVFTHEDAVGYTVKVTNGIDTLTMSNKCTMYPQISLTTLTEKVCANASPIPLTASSNPAASSYQYFYLDAQNQRVPITSFNPKSFPSNDTVFVKLEIGTTSPVTCPVTIVQPVIISTENCGIGKIGDLAFYDYNGNGKKDASEPGWNSAKVKLFKNNVLVDSTITDMAGKYLFKGLNAGAYKVFISPSQLPQDFQFTTAKVGTDSTVDSNSDTFGYSNVINILSKADQSDSVDLTVDFGISIDHWDPYGYIYCEETGEILKGGKVTVTGPPGAVIYYLADGTSGYYRWATNLNGVYSMTYSHPNGLTLSSTFLSRDFVPGLPSALDGSPLDKDGLLNGVISIGSNPNADTTYLLDFTPAFNPYYLTGEVEIGMPWVGENNIPVNCYSGQIGSLIWVDTNNNGINDPGEPGKSGIKVYLWKTDASGNPTVLLDSTTTDTFGSYMFSNLPFGDFKIQIKPSQLPSGFTLSTNQNVGSDLKDSDVNPGTGFSDKISLSQTTMTSLNVNGAVTTTVVCKPDCVDIIYRKLN